jgi:hypothetical protein
MKRNLMGSTYGKFCIKFAQSRMKDERHRLSPLSLSEEKIFLTLANQKQELLLAAIFVGQTERNEETL